MGNYVVSARKYRPGTFASILGQQHVSNTLKSAILLDQLAHAFLFSGPRGVGKTTCARVLAKAINCENLQEDGEPCNSCSSCKEFNEGRSMTIHELDAASHNGVDEIRNLIEQVRYAPTNGKRSVYIIDEVHMLSQNAFNAFLKTLEEPPAHVLFILATTEKHKILPTILSRCQKYDFRRIRIDDIADHLKYIAEQEEVKYEFAALQQIALKADGALRDALSLFDQLVSYTSGNISFESVLENLNILDYDYYFRAVEQIVARDHSALLLTLNEIMAIGFEPKDFVLGLTAHFRHLLVCRNPDTVGLLEVSEQVRERYLQQSADSEDTFLLNAFNLCSESERQLKYSTEPRLIAELMLIKLAHLAEAIEVATAPVAVPEKKKPLAESTAPPTDPPASSVVSEESAEKTTAGTSTSPANPKVASNGSGAQPEFQLADDIEALTSRIREKPDMVKYGSQKEETEKSYEISEGINLDQKQFDEALKQYIARAKENHKMSLASVLSNLESKLIHNRWEVKLQEAFVNYVKNDQDLLPYMRKAMGEQELFIEIEAVPNVQQGKSELAYSSEEKLKVLIEKNPALAHLQKLFNTRIFYDS